MLRQRLNLLSLVVTCCLSSGSMIATDFSDDPEINREVFIFLKIYFI